MSRPDKLTTALDFLHQRFGRNNYASPTEISRALKRDQDHQILAHAIGLLVDHLHDLEQHLIAHDRQAAQHVSNIIQLLKNRPHKDP